MRKRNRALSNKDFDQLMIGSGGWTFDPSDIDGCRLWQQDASSKNELQRRPGSKKTHNDRCKNRALAQTDFDRFIFRPFGGGLRKPITAMARSVSTTSNMSVMPWKNNAVQPEFNKYSKEEEGPSSSSSHRRRSSSGGAFLRKALLCRSKSDPIPTLPPTDLCMYPSDDELNRLEEIHPFFQGELRGRKRGVSSSSKAACALLEVI